MDTSAIAAVGLASSVFAMLSYAAGFKKGQHRSETISQPLSIDEAKGGCAKCDGVKENPCVHPDDLLADDLLALFQSHQNCTENLFRLEVASQHVLDQMATTLVETAHYPLLLIAVQQDQAQASNYLYAAAGHDLQRVQTQSPNWMDAPLQLPSMAAVLQTGQAVIYKDHRAAPAKDISGYHSCVGVPLTMDQDVVGVISVWLQHGDTDSNITDYLQMIGRQFSLGLTIRNKLEWHNLQGAAMDAAANSIFITNKKGDIEWVNKAFCTQTGYEFQELIGQNPSILKSGLVPEDRYEELWQAVSAGEIWTGELLNRRKDGTVQNVRQTITPVRDDQGQISFYIAIQEDITESKRAEERIRYLSNYDPLTQLPNRVLLRERLHEAVTECSAGQRIALFCIDLDQFSRVNDTLGNDAGDAILKVIADRILTEAIEADTVARIGGDEFAVILKDAPDGEIVAQVAQRLSLVMAESMNVAGQNVHVGVNIGIAYYPDDSTTADELINNADLAMYRAIRTETERYCFFSGEMNAEAKVRLDLESDLRRAIDRNEFVLHFQPQVSLLDGRIVGFEALVRWQHPDHGLVPPSLFVPVAEESGLILPMSDWVLAEALAVARDWRDEGLPQVCMAVNISAVQFSEGQAFVAKVEKMLSEYRIPPGFLELELTESMLMQDASHAVRLLSQLDRKGIKLAIDDFGTGYSSLAYLKQFPVHRLKLDQSFVRHMTDDYNDLVIARATINLGHSLGLEVIAEGVENQEQVNILKSESCDLLQGYFYSRPVPADKAKELLITYNT
jgi:diguanylate cyclase (GGDEF)-like protein/PAS domain S-box-containing protein